MVSDYWLPKYFSVISAKMNLEQVTRLVQMVYKEFVAKKGRPQTFVNMDRYNSIFMTTIRNLCSVIYENNSTVSLNKAELVKLLWDYLDALESDYADRGLVFKLQQIHSVYAMEVFYRWCEENYVSFSRYLEVGFNAHIKENVTPVEAHYCPEDAGPVFADAFVKTKAGVYEITI